MQVRLHCVLNNLQEVHSPAQYADCVKQREEEAFRIAEGQWIARLGTLDTQGGINSLDERSKL